MQNIAIWAPSHKFVGLYGVLIMPEWIIASKKLHGKHSDETKGERE